MISFLLKLLILLLLTIVVVGFLRTWQVQNDLRQKMFLGGSIPAPPLDGFYKGTVSGQEFSWLGKKFDSKNSTGINVFNDGFNSKNERYPFTTYAGKGLLDKNVDVLKIDYNVPANPFWLRFVLDEVVQIKTGAYRGKMELRIIPGFPFGVLYFELEK